MGRGEVESYLDKGSSKPNGLTEEGSQHTWIHEKSVWFGGKNVDEEVEV